MLALTVEIIQFRTGRGTCEVDDLLHNTLGAALGLLMFQICTRYADLLRFGKLLIQTVFPALMLCAGVLGCIVMARMVVTTNLFYTEQFWFSVEQVEGDTFSGSCHFYGSSTPDYKILLVSGTELLEAKVKRDGEDFTATAARTEGRKYEILVKFSGYSKLPTGVYLNGSQKEYVPGEVPVLSGEDGLPLLPNAELKAYSAAEECYIYQSGRELFWLVGEDVRDDAELIYHIYSSEPSQLPEQRRASGFDNLGFFPREPDRMLGSYRCFVRSIPSEYPVSSIIVGVNRDNTVTWNTSFRP